MPPTDRGIDGHSEGYEACLLTPTETGFPANSGPATVTNHAPMPSGGKIRGGIANRQTVETHGADNKRRLQRKIFLSSLLAIDGHMAVIDFEDHCRHRCAIQSATLAGVAATHVPTTVFMPTLGLRIN